MHLNIHPLSWDMPDSDSDSEAEAEAPPPPACASLGFKMALSRPK
jgi:hypothetical protein